MSHANGEAAALSPRVFHILLALAHDGESHGLEIAKSIEERTGGAIRLTPGTLYPLLHQLLVDRWIAEADDPDGNARRRPYRLTALGRAAARAEANRMQELIRAARSCNLIAAEALR